jgi:hypothetical protein
MRSKLLILALFLAAMPLLASTKHYPITPSGIYLADDETPIDCTGTDEGGWDCKENIPHGSTSRPGTIG